MTNQRRQRAISFAVSFFLLASSSASFADKTAGPTLNTGGSGGKPPVYPPTTYSDGGGFQLPGPDNSSSSGAKKPAPGTFGDVWGAEADGRKIYYEGRLNQNGQVRVWKYVLTQIDPDTKQVDPQKTVIQRGRVGNNPTAPDYQRVVWDWGGTSLAKLDAELSLKQQDVPANSGYQSADLGAIQKTFTGDVTEAKFREILGEDAKGQTIYFAGELSPESKARVWKFANSDAWVRRGTLTVDGSVARVVWDRDFFQYDRLNASTARAETESAGVSRNTPDSVFRPENRAQGRPAYYYEGKLSADGRELVYVNVKDSNGEFHLVKSAVNKDGTLQIVDDVILPKPSDERLAEIKAENKKSELQPAKTDNVATPEAPVAQGAATASAHAPGSLYKAADKAKGTPDYFYDGRIWNDGRELVRAIVEDSVHKFHVVTSAVNADGTLQIVDDVILPKPSEERLAELAAEAEAKAKAAPAPKADPEWRPSEVLRNGALSPELEQASQQVFEVARNGGNRIAPWKPLDGNISEKIQPNVGLNQIASGVGAFYFMLGMQAAYQILLDHPDNPAALENYFARFDKIHLMMAGGFMAVAYPFMKRVPGFTSGGNVLRSVPMFGAGMLAMSMVSIVTSVATTPDMQKCTGVLGYRYTGKFVFDGEACDRAYTSFFQQQLPLQVIPAMTEMAVTGTLFLGTYLVANGSGLAGLLRSIPVFESPKAGGYVGLGLFALSIVIWAGSDQISAGYWHVAKRSREYLLAKHTFVGNPYGATLRETEDNLFAGWEALKSRGFQDVAAFKASRPDCKYDFVPRAGGVPRDCKDTNPPLDFRGLLDRHAQLQDAWRTTEMAKTYDAYKQWMEKAAQYHSMLGATNMLYSDFVKRIAFELKNPGLSDIDARGFNATTMRNLERDYTAGTKYTVGEINGVPDLNPGQRAAGIKDTLIVDDPDAGQWLANKFNGKTDILLADPLYSQDFSGTWMYVNTKRFFDFVVTSMACGPEAEGNGRSWWLTDVTSTITGNYSPPEMIKDRTGRAVKFYPPRIVKPLSGTTATVCDSPAVSNPVIDRLLQPMPMAPEQFLVLAPWFSGRKDYKNLYAYIKDNVRDSILLNGENHFDNWWKSALSESVAVTENELRQEYEEMLTTTYQDDVFNHEYYYCDERDDVKQNGVFAEWLKLAPETRGGRSDCSPRRMHRLASGQINSLRDQLQLYLAMLVDMRASQASEKVSPDIREQETLDAAKDVMEAFDSYTDANRTLHSSVRESNSGLSNELNQSLNKLTLIVYGGAIPPDGVPLTGPQATATILLSKILPIFEQNKAFNVILSNFEPTGNTAAKAN